jgi:hypothetical protein
MSDHATPPAPPSVTGLRGSVRQTLNDLATLATDLQPPWAADPAEDGAAVDGAAATLDQLARELAEAAALARAITGHPRQAPAVPYTGRSALTGLLTAVIAALEIPPPAAAQDETTFLRLRSQRAAEAARACRRILDDRSSTDLDMAWTAAWLDDLMRQMPADSYEHNPMSS